MSAADDDWRLTSQDRYLLGAELHFAKYRTQRVEWDHDHCEFCWRKFSEQARAETIQAGYTTNDEYRWICPQCLEDFRERFKFKLVPDGPSPNDRSGEA